MEIDEGLYDSDEFKRQVLPEEGVRNVSTLPGAVMVEEHYLARGLDGLQIYLNNSQNPQFNQALARVEILQEFPKALRVLDEIDKQNI